MEFRGRMIAAMKMRNLWIMLLAVALPAAHATVTGTASTASFTCTNSTGPFPFTFPADDVGALLVIDIPALSAPGVMNVLASNQWTSTPVNNSYANGGSVTLVAPCTSGDTLVIARSTEQTQLTHFTQYMPALYTNFENGLDQRATVGQDVLRLDQVHPGQITGGGAASVTYTPLGQYLNLSLPPGPQGPQGPPGPVTNVIGGVDLSAGLYNNGWSLDAENTFSGLYGVGCLGDSNCYGFGTTNPGTVIGATNWISQVARDIGGGTVFNYSLSGDNPAGCATKSVISLSNLGATGNPLMYLDCGENTGRQGIITPSWTQAYTQYMTSAAVWPSIPNTSKYLVSDSSKWNAAGSWATQQIFVRSDVGASSAGIRYQVGDPIQAVCPSGTALTYTVTATNAAPLAGTIGSTNTGYTPGTYNNVAIAGGSGQGFLANITVGGGGNVTVVTPIDGQGRFYVVGDVFPIVVGGGSNATYTATLVGGPFTASNFTAFGNNACSSVGGLQNYATAPVNLGSGAVFTINYGSIQPFVSSASGNTLTTVIPIDVPPNGVGFLTYAQWVDGSGTLTVQEDAGPPLIDTLTQTATLTSQYDPGNYTLCTNQLGINFPGAYPTGVCTPTVGSGTPNAAIARFIGLTPGFHNFTITQTSNGKIGPVALEFPPSTHYRGAGAPGILIGGLKQVGFGDQTTEQYYSKINEQVAIQSIADGLNTPFFVENTLDPSVDFLSAQIAYVSDCSINAGVGHFDFAPLLPTGVNPYFPGWIGTVNTNGLYPIFSGACAPFNGATITTLQSGLTATAFNFAYVPASSTALLTCSSNGTNATVTNSGQNFLFPGWTGVIGGFSGACAPLNNATPITILSTGFSQGGFQFAYSGGAIAISTDAGTLTSVTAGNLAVSTDSGAFVPGSGNSYNGTVANTGNQSIVGHLSTGPNGGTTHMAGLAEAAARSFGFTSGITAMGGGVSVKPTASDGPGIGFNANAGALHSGTGWFPGIWPYADATSGLALGYNAEPISSFISYGGPSSNTESNALIAPTSGGTAFVSYPLTPGVLPATPSVATINEYMNSTGLYMLPVANATSGSNKASTLVSLCPSIWNGSTPDGTHCGTISTFASASGSTSGNVMQFRSSANTPANTGDQYFWLVGPTQHGDKFDSAALGSTFDINWLAPTMTTNIARPTQVNSGFPITAVLTTTAATTDSVTLNGMIASGHCQAPSATNSSAAAATVAWISGKTTNQVTVTHAVTSGMTYDIVCYAF